MTKLAQESADIAAVDLGSNSFHMVVARQSDGQLQRLDRLREAVQLATGLDTQQRIDADTEARALACLERFGQRLRGLPDGHVRAVGTNTLRQARNARAFLAKAEQALGHSIEIVSGIEEARLIYLGVNYSIAPDDRRRLVVDIGGGSTELVIGEGVTPRHLESLNIGCGGLSRRCFADGEISKPAWQAALKLARQELASVTRPLTERGWERAIGASGTAKAIRALIVESGWARDDITRDGLQRVVDLLLKAGTVDRLRAMGIGADRARVFPGGVAVMCAVFEALGLEELAVADGALREGLLFDLIGRLDTDDVRTGSIDALARRYHVDERHAQRVTATALELLAQARRGWALERPEYLLALRWAARLHEIGLDIAHSQYHKHGAYILRHADMAGFSRDEQALLAVLVRAHRRKFPVAEFEELPENLRLPAQRLALLLRLAVLLHRSRLDAPVPCRLTVDDASVSLSFPDAWLADQPLLQADLEQEAGYWQAAKLELRWS